MESLQEAIQFWIDENKKANPFFMLTEQHFSFAQREFGQLLRQTDLDTFKRVAKFAIENPMWISQISMPRHFIDSWNRITYEMQHGRITPESWKENKEKEEARKANERAQKEIERTKVYLEEQQK